MRVFETIGAWLLWAGGLVTPGPHDQDVQQPIGGLISSSPHEADWSAGRPPVWSPPHAPEEFMCDYTAMGPGWVKCNNELDRGCWLKNEKTGEKFDINTDYETKMPIGVTRKYYLNVTTMTLSGDGFKMPHGKVFNSSIPGPWITACWGDKVEIEVQNFLEYNGTSIHWHGIRQLNNNEADGVNGITQCPIAGYPFNDTYTYKWTVEQYGTTWYHSHYSLQYGDGLLGPLTLFGPSTANYDDILEPFLMTDNLHVSAFEAFYKEVVPGQGPPPMTNILLNGVGKYKCTADEEKRGTCVDQDTRYNVTVVKNKKYLLRLINTSVDTTFAFSIDNHTLEVITSDFVPIVPYNTSSILVGIGQRYHVILHAVPTDEIPDEKKRSYWIRTIPANGCYNFGRDAHNNPIVVANNTGILYYEGSELELPTTTQGPDVTTVCYDEPYDKLVPWHKWEVGYPSNQQENSTFEVSILPPPASGPFPPRGNFSRWSLGMQPMWLDFGDPTISHVNQRKSDWADNLVVIPELSKTSSGVKEDQWIYLLITSDPFPFGKPTHRNFVPVSHPIHLHGHDFALIAQSRRPYWPGFAHYKLDNPPRRDVALLPQGGFIIIAFKADNPGAWIVHCHIAWHASAGLAVQILERDGDIVVRDPEAISETCRNWKLWQANRLNWWHGTQSDVEFQDDSGI